MKIFHINCSDKVGGEAIAENRIHNALFGSKIDSYMIAKKSICKNEKILSQNISIKN